MISDMMDDPSESAPDAEWAWVARAYRDLPATRPEEVDRVAASVATAAARSRQRRKVARRLFSLAAVVVLALFGQRLVIGLRRSTVIAGAPSRRALTSGAASARSGKGPWPAASSDSARGRSTMTTPSRDTAATASDTAEAVSVPGPESIAMIPPVGVEPAPAAATGRRDTVTASAEIPGLAAADRARLSAALGDDGLRSLAALILHATRDGLPAASLLDRALAGVARDASASAILAAVERRAAALRQARDILGSGMAHGILIAGADALEAGAGPPQLAAVVQHFPEGRVTVGLLTLAGLITEGVPAVDAAGALVRGIDAGASDATLLEWRAGVAADVARGVPPLAALRAQTEGNGGKAQPEGDARPRGQNQDPVAPRSPVDLQHGP